MKKPIKKNLTDMDMLGENAAESTFETALFDEEKPEPKTKPVSKNTAPPDFTSAFISKELQENVGRALLELKVKLYKEGILDYKLKVSQEGHQVILTALPVTPQTGKASDRKEKKN